MGEGSFLPLTLLKDPFSVPAIFFFFFSIRGPIETETEKAPYFS